MSRINRATTDKDKFLQITRHIASLPKSLYVMGALPEQRSPAIAIVGTRRPSVYGKEVGYKLSYELAKRGVIIISGLALGIDSIAHRAALDAGGTTIAVLPCGLDRVYPSSHIRLAEEIVSKGGALVSEYPAQTETFPANFIARNRIVAGLSDGLLVIEAAAKSGTMHTVGFALEYNLPVMAVPGNITNPMSIGCNNLIKQGAKPATILSDILEEIGLLHEPSQTKMPFGDNAEEDCILKLIRSGLKDGDELHLKSGLPADEFSRTLTMLEINGKIRPLGGNYWGLS